MKRRYPSEQLTCHPSTPNGDGCRLSLSSGGKCLSPLPNRDSEIQPPHKAGIQSSRTSFSLSLETLIPDLKKKKQNTKKQRLGEQDVLPPPQTIAGPLPASCTCLLGMPPLPLPGLNYVRTDCAKTKGDFLGRVWKTGLTGTKTRTWSACPFSVTCFHLRRW